MDETLDVKDWLVLGDDVLLMGYHIKEKVAASRIEQFGLIAKDPPIANCTGMFLQRTYEYGFTMMSFGRALAPGDIEGSEPDGAAINAKTNCRRDGPILRTANNGQWAWRAGNA
ncbi:hypothetical protein Q1695_015729 [Nippostrongylus brasiliensis]|nr:hypothetical protein Q1695_015729 [Nippostrongylus brasiliensis]